MRKYLIIICSVLLASCSEKDFDFPTPGENEEMGSFELTLTGERQTRASSTISKARQTFLRTLIPVFLPVMVIPFMWKVAMRLQQNPVMTVGGSLAMLVLPLLSQ